MLSIQAAPGRRASRRLRYSSHVPLELVIFDCDGVLVDSERLAARVEARLMAAFGWPLSEQEIIERFLGRSEAYVLSEIELAVGRALPEWYGAYHEALHEAFRCELTPVTGVEEALNALAVPSCVASSGPHAKMRLTLGLTGLLDRFEGRLFSASEVDHGKPAPDLFLHAAASLGVQPRDCVVVEDSPAGIEAARAAGMRSLAYAGGLTPAGQLRGPTPWSSTTWLS